MSKKERLEKDPEGKRIINKTQLNIDLAAERGIIHRDYISHALRWTHIAKWMAKLRNLENFSILDVGCADFPLLRTIYTNKICPKFYMGVDGRNMAGKEGIKPNFEYEFKQMDFGVESLPSCKYGSWNIITFLEVLEHGSKEIGIKILENIKSVMSEETVLFLSTPCFSEKGQAENHVYEWKHEELKEQLNSMFNIEACYGTFASQSEIIPVMDEHELSVFNKLRDYYDSNFLSVIFAPNHPEASRNAIYRLMLKK